MSAEATVRAGRVLVTGAGGFLGANLVWTLREHGFMVRALLRRPPRGPRWTGLDGVEFVIGDIRNSADVARAVEGVTGVLHAAGLMRLIPRPRRDAYRVNVEGTRTVCAAARRAGVRRLVFTSSASTIEPGTAERPGTEESPANRGPIRAPIPTANAWPRTWSTSSTPRAWRRSSSVPPSSLDRATPGRRRTSCFCTRPAGAGRSSLPAA